MPYADGSWGENNKKRSKRRLEYFKQYQKEHPHFYDKTNYKTNYKRKFEGFGSLGEKIGLQILLNSKLVRKKYFDIEWENKKVEVKIAKLSKRNDWKFHTERQKGHTDYFLLICTEIDKKTVLRIYLIPDSYIRVIQPTHVSLRKDRDRFVNFRIESEVKNLWEQ